MIAFSPTGITAPQDWLDGLLPRLPGFAPDTVKHEILSIVRDFFQRSYAWQDWIELKLKANTVLYSPELTDYKAEICFILAGRHKDEYAWLRPAEPMYPIADILRMEKGRPDFYNLTPERMFCIFPAPETDDAYVVRLYCAMKPIDLCMPDWIKSLHYEAIRDGVLANLYALPGVIYKPDLALMHLKKYENAINKATVDARTAYAGIQEMVPFNHRFARGYQRRSSAGSPLWGWNL